MAWRLLKKSEAKPFDVTARIRLVVLVVFLFAVLLLFRLFSLEIIQHEFYQNIASNTQELNKLLQPTRGPIYVSENGKLYPLVSNQEYFFVYAEPNKITQPTEIIDKITPILGLTDEEWHALLPKLQDSKDPYQPIKHKVTKQQVDQIKAFNLSGINFISESFRYYPEKNIGGHIFGFVSYDGQNSKGQYGLEGCFDRELTGQIGKITSIKDALGQLVTIGPRDITPAQNGDELVLSIDRKIQFAACQKLKNYYEYFKAKNASIIIMDPKTGAIISMCSYPDFDPANYNQVKDINDFNNPAIFYDFEPGSVFKAFTMAAAIDAGKVTPDTTYLDEGEIKIGPYTIKNSDNKSHGQQTMTQVLEQSLNTGAIFAANEVGKDVFIKYVKNFGFGQKTGIQLDTEVAGNLSNLDKAGEIFYLTASFGQGITVTPIQLIAAFGAIANQGKLMKPYIVSSVIKPDGTKINTKPTTLRQVISSRTATLVTGMLTSVIKNGLGKKAGVAGYYLAGKTGTAQVASPDGGYGKNTIHSFIGFGPVTNPKFVILVKLDSPQGINYAADSVTPLFSQMSQFLLNYYQIPPDY